MSILIADDHERERTWLRELLTSKLPVHLPVHEAKDGNDAVEACRTHRPAIAFLDIEMPGISGIKAAEQILQFAPGTGIIILSHHSDEVWVRQLWKVMPSNGTFAYVLKDATDAQIVEAAEAVLAGDCWIHPRIQRMFVHSKAGSGTLTDGEFEVLAYICLGLTDRAIASRLYLTEKAIQARLKSVYAKFGMAAKGSTEEESFNHRCRAINVALRRGLINRAQLEEWEAQLMSEKVPGTPVNSGKP